MGILNLENCNGLLPTDSQKMKTRWRCSITTEERLALTFMLVHILYNVVSIIIRTIKHIPKSSSILVNTLFVCVCVWVCKYSIYSGQNVPNANIIRYVEDYW
jgi:uncharacterized membrane protein